MNNLSGQKWLVLGASGFIGVNLCRKLIKSGADVVAFGRKPKVPIELEGCEWVFGDFYDQDTLALALVGVNFVVNAVSTTTPANSNLAPILDIENNLIGSLKLVELCKSKGIQRLIFLSSGGTVYGPDVNTPTPEETPTNPACSYGIVKLAIEKYLGLYRQQGDLDSVILRISNPFGPFQLTKGQGVIAAFINQILKNQPIILWGDGSVIRDYLYIDDLINAIICAAELDNFNAPYIFNIGSGEGKSINKIIKSLTDIHGNINVIKQPSRLCDVPVSVLDIRRANAFLGWSPNTDWISGLESTYNWFKQLDK